MALQMLYLTKRNILMLLSFFSKLNMISLTIRQRTTMQSSICDRYATPLQIHTFVSRNGTMLSESMISTLLKSR